MRQYLLSSVRCEPAASLPEDHVHILWLLPITQSEREYCKEHGAEAMESRFEEAGLEFWKLDRDSVL